MTSTPNPSQETEIPALMRLSEVCAILNISMHAVRRLIERGDIAASTISAKNSARRHVRITRDSLLKFYQKRFGHSLLRALAHRHES